LHDRYQPSEHLYMLPIGGTAMAPLAGMLAELGYRVEGVDSRLYPPMSTLLAELGIPVRLGFDGELVPAEVDRVVIGNAVPRTNPEVVTVLARGTPYLSQAEAVAHYVLARGQSSLVVAGTHGKTTTASMLAWILEASGRDPSYLIGGVPHAGGRPYRLGRGRELVIEGDEYNTAFFDRGPKFLHYRPHVLLLGPIEFDHADIYRDFDAVLTAFRAGAAQVPRHGAVVVNAFSDAAVAAARDAAAAVVTVGPNAACTFRLTPRTGEVDRSLATIHWQDRPYDLEIPAAGVHNLHNAAMAVAAAVISGIDMESALAAMARFAGVARRLEVVGEAAGVTVVDDFAHHPTAVAATVAAARQRWPRRRLVVAFEPRSITAARRGFQQAYLDALAGADLILVAAPFYRDRLEPEETLDRAALAADLAGLGVAAVMPEGDSAAALAPHLAAGDVVVGCSSGSFEDFHRRLLAELRVRCDGAAAETTPES
jgi:UDP-N-acetylmuramate: L-alanyl-gamma-D-glutamyl-meso-diaminopimelate ligase